MNPKNQNRYLVDILFVLTLFALFTLSSILVIILGANVYQKTVQEMDSNYSSRTSYSYFSEKLHQSDQNSTVSILYFEDQNVLCIEQTLNDTEYRTYLYEYNGALMECFTRAENEFHLGLGNEILPISDLTFETTIDRLLQISFVDGSGNSIILYVEVNQM